MRHVGFVLATAVLAVSFLGCPLLKKKNKEPEDEDPSPVLADASTVTVSGTGAKNEDAVLRYANETPLPNVPAMIAKDGTIARNFPGNGPTVAVLNRGTVVAKMAQYFSTATLVMFDDPTGDGSKLIGWVPPTAFDVAAPPPTKQIVPPKPPAKDAGAPVPDAGGGNASTDAGGGNASTDAGGGNASKDAGGGGNSLPQPRPGQVAVQPVDGKCPDGWAVSQNMCRKKCNDDKECFRNTSCKAKGGPKVCSSDH